MKLIVKGEVWKYPGPASWYFVYVGDKESKKIKSSSKSSKRVGFGFVPIEAQIGKTKWKTTLFPSKEGPYLIKPEVTNRPKVTPKIYKVINKKIRGGPILNIETPKKGIARRAAGIKPIRVLRIAVKVKAVIISLSLIGAINRLVKFLLQISSRNIIL